MGLGDDLREVIAGVVEAISGGRKAVRAAGATADRLDGVVDDMTSEATVVRVARAGLGATFDAAGQDAKMAAASPRTRLGGQPRKCLGIACDRHGNQRWAVWRKTLV